MPAPYARLVFAFAIRESERALNRIDLAEEKIFAWYIGKIYIYVNSGILGYDSRDERRGEWRTNSEIREIISRLLFETPRRLSSYELVSHYLFRAASRDTVAIPEENEEM